MEFAVVVEGNGGTNDKSIWEGQISARVVDVTEVLLSLTTVKNVMVSMNEDSYHWTGEVPAGRVKGRTIKWVSKSRGREELSIEWKLGIRDDGYVPGQVTYAAHQANYCGFEWLSVALALSPDLCKVFTLKDKFLSDPKFAFTLEAYANDTPAPNILPKESNRVLQSIIDY
jgi:hypothetical protein